MFVPRFGTSDCLSTLKSSHLSFSILSISLAHPSIALLKSFVGCLHQLRSLTTLYICRIQRTDIESLDEEDVLTSFGTYSFSAIHTLVLPDTGHVFLRYFPGLTSVTISYGTGDGHHVLKALQAYCRNIKSILCLRPSVRVLDGTKSATFASHMRPHLLPSLPELQGIHDRLPVLTEVGFSILPVTSSYLYQPVCVLSFTGISSLYSQISFPGGV